MATSFLVISCSLKSDSFSRILAQQVHALLPDSDYLDLSEVTLPLCDGDTCYALPEVKAVTERIEAAHGILLATPIYNYDSNAVAKNLIELTGGAWRGKIVGFACAAGGRAGYMSIMGLANSLMLDFRCWIVPRFVYATGEHFRNEQLIDSTIRERLEELVGTLQSVTSKLFGTDGNPE